MPSIIANRSIIKISGPGSTKFLQNLVTNDVTLIRHSALDAECIYAMMLSPQGRFLFDMFIIPTEQGYLLDVFTDTKEFLLKKLRMYKINMRVEIEDLIDLYVGYSSVIARSAGTTKQSPFDKNEIASSSLISRNDVVYKDPRHKEIGYRMVLDSSLHGNDNNDESYLHDKYLLAIPDGGIDLLYDKAMPQEYGAEQLHAISYTKGCYVGQEVISRTKSQGVVRKKIYKVTADFDLSNILHSTEIMLDGAKVGIFCSGYMKEGVALIREGDTGMLEDKPYSLNNNTIRLNPANWYKNP